jgi:hypothetical protein
MVPITLHDFFLAKRTFVIILIFTVGDEHWGVKVVQIFIYQMTSLCYSGVVRPFEDVKDNLIEIVNDLMFAFFLAFNILNHSEETWSYAESMVLIYAMSLNHMILALIIYIDFAKQICMKIKKCKAKKLKKTFKAAKYNSHKSPSSYLFTVHPPIDKSEEKK